MDDQNKNLILATALSFLVILIWFLLFPPPEPEPQPVRDLTVEDTAPEAAPPGIAPAPPSAVDTAPSGAAPAPDATAQRQEDLPRLRVDTPELTGTVSLLGGRIDDLSLKDYRETIDPDSPLVTLLSPVGQPNAYYALYGWAPGGALGFEDVPGANTAWSVESGEILAPGQPVILRWDNGSGLIFRRTIEVDDRFLVTVRQSVQNTSSDTARLAPYGIVARHGTPDTINFFILHEGVVRMSDGELQEVDYGKMEDLDQDPREGARVEILDVAENGLIGFTDKNWMTTLIPAPGQSFRSVAKYVPGADIFQTETRLPTRTVGPGETVEVETYLFAGAKEWEAIRDYQNGLGVEGFIDSIDWGWFFFLTKPIFWLLHELNVLIGNMGWSIIALTLIIKSLLLPLAWKSYTSMAKMKELQPEMEKLRERAGDDRQKLQEGMMELYKKNKVNPASGCLPILLQIPIFFSLY